MPVIHYPTCLSTRPTTIIASLILTLLIHLNAPWHPPRAQSRPHTRPTSTMKRRFSEEKYEPESRSSPSVSSSHGEGGLADTETDANPSHSDAGPSQLSGIPSRSQLQETGVQAQQAAPPPQKKKRTRTLTTPHQSAVLHALLAQVTRSHSFQGVNFN